MKSELEDLSPLARRGELTPPEEQRLDGLLQASAEARLFHDLGSRFDAEDPSPPVADAASQAVVEAVLKEVQKSESRKRRALPRSVWLIAAAAVLAASLAGAVTLVQRLRSAPAPTPAAVERPGVAASAPRAIARAAPAIAAPSAPSEQPAAPALSAELSPPRAVPSSAAELLSAAGRARRSGRSAEAVELLQTLRSRYPQSPEAGASDITLGKLELERGAPAVALGHFDGYLRRSPEGALLPEALWGRAQALTQLGRSGEARKSLSELLQRFPHSPYASAARAKLGGAVANP